MNWLIQPGEDGLSSLCGGFCLIGTCCNETCYCAKCISYCPKDGQCWLFCATRGPYDPQL